MMQKGEEIDVWIVDAPLGAGGMGSVYRCHNRNAARILAAVKVLDPSLRCSETAKARFVREAEILFSLDHPGIVKVRNIRMDGPTPYLEMEFVDGMDLERRLHAGPIEPDGALPLLRQVAEALAYLHARGVRHRDIKPANLILQADGIVKIVDFGIATESDGLNLTTVGQACGSIAYVPPEWLAPATLDPMRWDVYSTGVVFWELLLGRQAYPMHAGSFQQQMVRVLSEKAQTEFLDLPADQPEGLRSLIRDMTLRDPARRLTAAEVVQRLALVSPPNAPTLPAGSLAPPFPGHRSRRTLVPYDPLANTVPWFPESRTWNAPERLGGPAGVSDGVEPLRARAPHVPRWRSSLLRAQGPFGDDPSFAIGSSRTVQWLEVRWERPECFAEWCAAQLVNYTLMLPSTDVDLPSSGRLRVLLSHGTLNLDCSATVQVATPKGVAYRLELDALQIHQLRRWPEGCP